MENLN